MTKFLIKSDLNNAREAYKVYTSLLADFRKKYGRVSKVDLFLSFRDSEEEVLNKNSPPPQLIDIVGYTELPKTQIAQELEFFKL